MSLQFLFGEDILYQVWLDARPPLRTDLASQDGETGRQRYWRFKSASNPNKIIVMSSELKSEPVPLAINEAQLVLAEMRTSLAVMRTGIAVLALPLSVISVLIATSKYYDVFHVLHLLIPLGILNSALICLGVYLIVRSLGKMRHYERLIHEIKLKHSVIGEFIL